MENISPRFLSEPPASCMKRLCEFTSVLDFPQKENFFCQLGYAEEIAARYLLLLLLISCQGFRFSLYIFVDKLRNGTKKSGKVENREVKSHKMSTAAFQRKMTVFEVHEKLRSGLVYLP